MAKILVLGAKGFIGKKIVEVFSSLNKHHIMPLSLWIQIYFDKMRKPIRNLGDVINSESP